ncbi:hypothetical protein VTN02DRAFT_79 [Thermoascus thermophilus]
MSPDPLHSCSSLSPPSPGATAPGGLTADSADCRPRRWSPYHYYCSLPIKPPPLTPPPGGISGNTSHLGVVDDRGSVVRAASSGPSAGLELSPEAPGLASQGTRRANHVGASAGGNLLSARRGSGQPGGALVGAGSGVDRSAILRVDDRRSFPSIPSLRLLWVFAAITWPRALAYAILRDL